MRVIGTAGHVDHGKSTLVEALTGTHPDRLKEEQEREMTIDLGFAWITLPGGEEAGIVDVPGHRDFIENMLAGIGGIDAAILVIAADEGVMPQTREHLAILDLLDIRGGVIVLTKTDLVVDEEWLDLVEEEVRQVVSNTVLENADIIRVSARKRTGLETLVSSLEAVLARMPARNDLGRPRLPVDRVFSVAGFGTVVTGTLSDGRFSVGEDIEIQPSGRKGRIRGLQSHQRKNEQALPGSRTAINISGIDVNEISRGDVVIHPGDYRPTRRIDVQVRVLEQVDLPVRHNDETKLFIGAAEMIGRIRLLGTESLNPGEMGWLQIELRNPIVCHRGDRYILRRPSPAETIAGGIVLDPYPKRRYKRMHIPTLERLSALAQGDPQDILEQALQSAGIISVETLGKYAMLPDGVFQTALAGLIEANRIIVISENDGSERLFPAETLIVTRETWENLRTHVRDLLGQYHRAYPLRAGMPREELKSKLNLQTRPFALVMQKLAVAGDLVARNSSLALTGHRVNFTPAQTAAVRQLISVFAQTPATPPSVKEAQKAVGEEVYQALVDRGDLVQISADVVYRAEDYQHIRQEILLALEEHEQMTVAQVRDMLQTSRKYVLAILEHFDALGLTVRAGDYRRLRPMK
jgi:selenocysteine-specific elongation factor